MTEIAASQNTAQKSTEEIGMIEEGNWVLTVDDFMGELLKQYIWLDSACFDHVCPKWFADTVPIDKCGTTRVIRAAGGQRLKLYG